MNDDARNIVIVGDREPIAPPAAVQPNPQP